jgi:hypothetical protein
MLKTGEHNITESESLIGKVFKRRDKEVYITVINADTEKTKTGLVEFSDGKTMRLSLSVLNDHSLWVPFEGDVPEPEAPEPETYVAGTEDTEPEIQRKPIPWHKRENMGAKAIENAPWHNGNVPSKKKKVTQPKNMMNILKRVAERTRTQLQEDASKPGRYTYRRDGKPVIEIYTGKWKIRISTRREIMEYYATYRTVEYTTQHNYYMDAAVMLPYEDEDNYTSIMKELISLGIDYNKNHKSTRKTKNKEEKENGSI